jgi:hypothetical protein
MCSTIEVQKNSFFGTLSPSLALMFVLLQIQICYYKTNFTTAVILRGEYFSSLYFVKTSPHRKMFHFKVTDMNKIYILLYVQRPVFEKVDDVHFHNLHAANDMRL